MSQLLWAVADSHVVAKRNLIKIKRVPEVLVFVLLSRSCSCCCSPTCSAARSTSGRGRATASS
jgi:hypothetical protein